MKAPFPWFGGKSRCADLIWSTFAGVKNYVEPFAGSMAVLLAGPTNIIRTVNDIDGFICNFWRSVTLSPDETAKWADWPVNEADLHARHAWLLAQRAELTDRLMGDPNYHDPRIAGYWVWGVCCWIGSGFCSGIGPWESVGGKLVKTGGHGIKRNLPHLGDRGQGINRKLPHLGDRHDFIQSWFRDLSKFLRDVRVCCGDWTRILGFSVTTNMGKTGVFLDPPYSADVRDTDIYALDSMTVAQDVQHWCVENQNTPDLLIALCGYEGDYDLPGWDCVAWHAISGFQTKNARKERIWFSPQCAKSNRQVCLFQEG